MFALFSSRTAMQGKIVSPKLMIWPNQLKNHCKPSEAFKNSFLHMALDYYITVDAFEPDVVFQQRYFKE